ncbi:MAG TPA: hypothetical protein PKJ37_00415 [Acidobacteriota bacterium]|nr:hypothetical protein [Acidobacteriota bacterium]HNT16341.1 hypothetical protein [Acidobacteriota bacterium]
MNRIGRIKNPVITRKARSIPNEVIYLILKMRNAWREPLALLFI